MPSKIFNKCYLLFQNNLVVMQNNKEKPLFLKMCTSPHLMFTPVLIETKVNEFVFSNRIHLLKDKLILKL